MWVHVRREEVEGVGASCAECVSMSGAKKSCILRQLRHGAMLVRHTL
jgi:hypothetical protein